MLHNDMKYLMTLKNRVEKDYKRIYDYCSLNCYEENKGSLHECEYLLDSSFIEYLSHEDIYIISMRKDCIDMLMINIKNEIERGLITQSFILYNLKGIKKVLQYCAKNKFTRYARCNRYVIHYFNHRIQKDKEGKCLMNK